MTANEERIYRLALEICGWRAVAGINRYELERLASLPTDFNVYEKRREPAGYKKLDAIFENAQRALRPDISGGYGDVKSLEAELAAVRGAAHCDHPFVRGWVARNVEAARRHQEYLAALEKGQVVVQPQDDFEEQQLRARKREYI